MPIAVEHVCAVGVSIELAVNTITTAARQVLVQATNPKSSINAGKSSWPQRESESALDIEAIQSRAETVTTVLQEILGQNRSSWIGGNNESAN